MTVANSANIYSNERFCPVGYIKYAISKKREWKTPCWVTTSFWLIVGQFYPRKERVKCNIIDLYSCHCFTIILTVTFCWVETLKHLLLLLISASDLLKERLELKLVDVIQLEITRIITILNFPNINCKGWVRFNSALRSISVSMTCIIALSGSLGLDWPVSLRDSNWIQAGRAGSPGTESLSQAIYLVYWTLHNWSRYNCSCEFITSVIARWMAVAQLHIPKIQKISSSNLPHCQHTKYFNPYHTISSNIATAREVRMIWPSPTITVKHPNLLWRA